MATAAAVRSRNASELLFIACPPLGFSVGALAGAGSSGSQESPDATKSFCQNKAFQRYDSVEMQENSTKFL
jgi:hypothetical protein